MGPAGPVTKQGVASGLSLAVEGLLGHISSCVCGASVTSHQIDGQWVIFFSVSISVTLEVTFCLLSLASLVCCVGSHGDTMGRP